MIHLYILYGIITLLIIWMIFISKLARKENNKVERINDLLLTFIHKNLKNKKGGIEIATQIMEIEKE